VLREEQPFEFRTWSRPVAKPSKRSHLELVDQCDFFIWLAVPLWAEYRRLQIPIQRVGVAAPPHLLPVKGEAKRLYGFFQRI
jgi:hypothetical protein